MPLAIRDCMRCENEYYCEGTSRINICKSCGYTNDLDNPPSLEQQIHWLKKAVAELVRKVR